MFVCMELWPAYNKVILGVVGLAPGRHDKGIVEGNDDDLINTLGLQSLDVVDEAGDVVDRASRRKGTRNGHEDDLLLAEL